MVGAPARGRWRIAAILLALAVVPLALVGFDLFSDRTYPIDCPEMYTGQGIFLNGEVVALLIADAPPGPSARPLSVATVRDRNGNTCYVVTRRSIGGSGTRVAEVFIAVEDDEVWPPRYLIREPELREIRATGP